MRKFKSIFHTLPAIIIAIALFSCGGSATKTGDTTAKAGADTTKKAAAPAVAVPFDVVDVRHTVKDYDKWRPIFDADSANRTGAGMQNIVVARDADNANDLLIVFKLADIAKAKAMSADPKLKATMDKAGVISKPDFAYYHVIRFSSGDAGAKQFVVVNHKVKDFAAWLKVYDGEGPAKRASEGMVDVALSRGIDDTTMVHLAFAVTDMAKAKAAIMSDDKKKLMMSAGVIGKPDIHFYNNTAK